MSKILNKKFMYGMYAVSLCFLIVGLVVLSNKPKIELEQPTAVIDILSKLTTPVIDEVTEEKDTIIGRPYSNDNVEIVQSYYDYKGEEKNQTESIIFYQDTYIQSSGVSYSLNNKTFDVISVLDGEVIDIKEDVLLGNSIKIKHSENVFSIYQSINNISVKVGDIIKKGDVIAQSSTSNINNGLNNHLYFELIIDDVNVNPEEYFDKSL